MLRIGVGLRLGGGLAGVEQDAGWGLPIAGRAGPARGAHGPGGLVEGVPLGQERAIFAAVALAWGDELEGAVAVGLVIPKDERGDPGARSLEAFERLLGVPGSP
jgi:hypothetical protein